MNRSPVAASGTDRTDHAASKKIKFLAPSQIKEISTEASFERGEEYYMEDRVMSPRISRSAVTATVTGTHQYAVNVSLRPGKRSYSCTCPYDYEGVCKHIVAVLLYVMDNGNEMLKDDALFSTGIRSILSSISSKQIRDFVLSEVDRDEHVRKQFLVRFGGMQGMLLRDYGREIQAAYANAQNGDDYWGEPVDLDEFFADASACSNAGDHSAATRIYYEIAKNAARNMYDTDYPEDSREYIEKAICGIASCATRQNLNHQKKRRHIAYIFKMWSENEIRYDGTVWQQALEGMCTGIQDLEYLCGMIETALSGVHVSKNRYNKYGKTASLIRAKISLLGRMGDDAALNESYKAHYRDDPEICTEYVRRLSRTDPSAAVRIAVEGIRAFPGIYNKIGQIYKKSDPMYGEILKDLFLETGEWRHYNRLKRISKDWDDIVESMIEYLNYTGSFTVIVDMLVREKMFDRAISRIMESRDLAALEQYHFTLCSRYPEQYHRAYKSLLTSMGIGKGRRSYKNFAAHLKKMRSVPGHGTGFREFLSEIRFRNSKKHAFLEEIRHL